MILYCKMHHNNAITDEAYMFEFRTNFCKKKRCRNASKCFDAHSKHMKRRVPKLNADGLFNYIPEECLQWKNSKKENKCNAGERCLRSHGWLEKIFHPLLYKTKICESSHKNGICSEYGAYCAFAKNQSEVRSLVKIYGEGWKQHYDLSEREKKGSIHQKYIKKGSSLDETCAKDKTSHVANQSKLTTQWDEGEMNKMTDSGAVLGHSDSLALTFSSPSLSGTCGSISDLLANFPIDDHVTSYVQLYSDNVDGDGCGKTLSPSNSACHLPALPWEEWSSISDFMRPFKGDNKMSDTYDRDCYMKLSELDIEYQTSNAESKVSDVDKESQMANDQMFQANSLFAHFNFGYE